MKLETELNAALTAAAAAAKVCQAVRERMVTPETLEKKDRSPVTVADYASQAIVCATLAKMTPDIPVVAEEDAADLRQAENQSVCDVVVEQVRSTLGSDIDVAGVIEWIDRGGHTPRGGRYWTLDPIDGTKGFLRAEQYAVALGLIEDGKVVLGVLACPNLTVSRRIGALLYAAKGHGSFVTEIAEGAAGNRQQIHVSAERDTAKSRFCESVESGHSDQDLSVTIAQRLGITLPPVRMDSQCKYGVVADAQAEIYLRLPTRADYREKIWDHAAGAIVIEEAGGRVTDINGSDLDFSLGRTLDANRGVVATNGAIHDQVIEAVQAAMQSIPL